MDKENLRFSDYKKRFYDEYGNRINNYVISFFTKKSNGEWVKEEERKTHSGDDYVIDRKIYFKCNDTLIPYNMDFESKDCGRCATIIGEDTEEYKKITGNELIMDIPEIHRAIYKQSYSDGTCFYTLKDVYGRWNVGDGSHYLDDVLKRIEIYIPKSRYY